MNNKLGWAARLYEHAVTHYEEDGWDYVVETMEAYDILDYADKVNSYEELVIYVGDIVSVWDEQRRSARAEIF